MTHLPCCLLSEIQGSENDQVFTKPLTVHHIVLLSIPFSEGGGLSINRNEGKLEEIVSTISV